MSTILGFSVDVVHFKKGEPARREKVVLMNFRRVWEGFNLNLLRLVNIFQRIETSQPIEHFLIADWVFE